MMNKRKKMLKIWWEINRDCFTRSLHYSGVTENLTVNAILDLVQREADYAFEAGRDFQKRYKEEEEEEK